MKTNFYLAGLAGGVFNFFLGWLVYGILLMSFMEANTIKYEGLSKEMPDMLLLSLSCLATAFFLAFIFEKWAKIATLKGGFVGGLIIGLFICVIYDLSFLSMYNLFNKTMAVVDILVGGVMYGATGAVVGWVLSTGKKTE